MPYYPFKCQSCDRVFEETKTPSKDDITQHPCPVCQQQAARYYGGQKVSVHGGPTTGARKVR